MTYGGCSVGLRTSKVRSRKRDTVKLQTLHANNFRKFRKLRKITKKNIVILEIPSPINFRIVRQFLKCMEMGLVHITSWYPNFNGSHFGLPPSESHRMTGLPPKIV